MQQAPTRPSRWAAFLARPAALAALLVVAVALFAAMSTRPLTRSELRYVEAGAEMATSGDWVVPHLAFVPYFEKPILAYWLEAASQLVFGRGDLAVRLPALLAGLGMLWLTYEMGRGLRGRAFGLGAAALLLASVYFLGMASVVTTDPPFAFFLVLAWYAFRRHDLDPGGRWIWLFWTAAGLALLTKGPLGPALLAVSVGAYLVAAGRARDAARMRLLPGVALALAINVPWSVLVWLRDPRFLHFFYIRQNLQAFIDPNVNHPGPPWFYVPWIVGMFFPFALLATWGAVAESGRALSAAARRLRREPTSAADTGALYVACMIVPPVLLLSAAGSKLGTYLLPLVPAFSLAAAAWIADRIERPCGVLRYAQLAQVAVLVPVLAVFPRVMERRPEVAATLHDSMPAVGASVAAILVGGAVGGFLMARRRTLAGMAFVAGGSVVGVLVGLGVVDTLSQDTDASSLMPKLLAARRPGETVVLAGTCAEDFAVVLALGERVPIWGGARELGMGHFVEVTSPDVPIPDGRGDGDPRPGPYEVGSVKLPLLENPWLFDDARLRAAWSGRSRAWFVGRPKDVEKLRAMGLAVHVIASNDKRAVAANRATP
jgi:4-amino-4-deoxy-L-arabinose transferase-like glycosyltransferase